MSAKVLVAILGGAAALAAVALTVFALANPGILDGVDWVIPVLAGAVVGSLGWLVLAEAREVESSRSLASDQRCPVCGEQVLSDWRLCPHCGAIIDEGQGLGRDYLSGVR
jgi:hypothetical protein